MPVVKMIVCVCACGCLYVFVVWLFLFLLSRCCHEGRMDGSYKCWCKRKKNDGKATLPAIPPVAMLPPTSPILPPSLKIYCI